MDNRLIRKIINLQSIMIVVNKKNCPNLLVTSRLHQKFNPIEIFCIFWHTHNISETIWSTNLSRVWVIRFKISY